MQKSNKLVGIPRCVLVERYRWNIRREPGSWERAS